jgi:proteasome lid subunit RPN8/RPN11
MWVHGGLVLASGVLSRVESEAVAAYARDEESCGFLVGPAEEPLVVDEVMPVVNRANKLHALDPVQYPRTGRMYFDIDTLAFEKKVRAQAAAGRPVKVLYHCHLDVGAYFSETDAAAATMGGSEPPYPLAYLVTSVRALGVDDHRLFIWDAATRSFIPASFRSAEEPGGPAIAGARPV